MNPLLRFAHITYLITIFHNFVLNSFPIASIKNKVQSKVASKAKKSRAGAARQALSDAKENLKSFSSREEAKEACRLAVEAHTQAKGEAIQAKRSAQ